jgi:hypothetical protein
MKKEIADLWIAALKSNKYEKGKYVLEKNDTFCCLGVLCDVALKNGVEFKRNIDDRGVFYGDNSSSEGRYVLLPIVQQWAGMKSLSGIINKDDALTSINDRTDSFHDVIYAIEKNWEQL